MSRTIQALQYLITLIQQPLYLLATTPGTDRSTLWQAVYDVLQLCLYIHLYMFIYTPIYVYIYTYLLLKFAIK